MENIEEKSEPALELKNHMEDVVDHIFKDMIKKTDICHCETCKKDIIAYALNHLPPKYAVTHKGEVFYKVSEFTQQFEIDVQIALTEAIKVISKNPRHSN